MDNEPTLALGEKIVELIETGRRSATYKLATLIAILDTTNGSIGPGRVPPEVLSGKEVASRVVELYWPQTVAYGASPDHGVKPLRQSPHNDIPAKLAQWRLDHNLPSGAALNDARMADPDAWAALEQNLIATVIRMPLAKLQRFGSSSHFHEERFLYEFSWEDEAPVSSIDRPDFDDSMRLLPGVGEQLIRLTHILRPFLQGKWISQVAGLNPDLVDSDHLDEFLFGATRIALGRIREPLMSIQNGRCFYCGRRFVAPAEVDHFVPWSRHPDNTLDNLVAAHANCNRDKSASLACVNHLERWLTRFDPASPTFTSLNEAAKQVIWPRRPDQVLSSARAAYLWLPVGSRLWISGAEYEMADAAVLAQLLG